MKDKLKTQWFTVPVWIRKPLIFIVGMIFIVTAALTGWLPGPGGIPLFLVGIAILATEFVWAQRFKRVVMGIVYAVASWYRHHRELGNLLIVLGAAIASLFLMFAIRAVFRFS